MWTPGSCREGRNVISEEVSKIMERSSMDNGQTPTLDNMEPNLHPGDQSRLLLSK